MSTSASKVASTSPSVSSARTDTVTVRSASSSRSSTEPVSVGATSVTSSEVVPVIGSSSSTQPPARTASSRIKEPPLPSPAAPDATGLRAGSPQGLLEDGANPAIVWLHRGVDAGDRPPAGAHAALLLRQRRVGGGVEDVLAAGRV